MDAKIIIEKLGGCAAVAREFAITRGAVWQWKTHGIPRDKLELLKLRHPRALGVRNAKKKRKSKQKPKSMQKPTIAEMKKSLEAMGFVPTPAAWQKGEAK
jgi:hypothetical protein